MCAQKLSGAFACVAQAVSRGVGAPRVHLMGSFIVEGAGRTATGVEGLVFLLHIARVAEDGERSLVVLCGAEHGELKGMRRLAMSGDAKIAISHRWNRLSAQKKSVTSKPTQHNL